MNQQIDTMTADQKRVVLRELEHNDDAEAKRTLLPETLVPDILGLR